MLHSAFFRFAALSLICFSLSAAQDSYRWNSLAIGGAGFVSAVITSPQERNLIYARTDVGGAYRWNESNQSWIPLTDWVGEDQVGFLGVEALAIDPRATNRLYMLVGISYFNSGRTAILRSTDRGNSFTVTEVTNQFRAHGNGMGRQNGERLAVDPNDGRILFCGTRAHGLFRSMDYGATWSHLSSLNVTTTPNENGIAFVVFDPRTGTAGTATQTIFVGVSRMGSTNLFRSIDGGASWSAVPGQNTDFMPQRAVLASDGVLYVTYGNGAGPHGHWQQPEPMDAGALRKFNTANNTWTTITPPGFSRAMGGISVDAANPQRILATSINTYMQQPWGWGDRIFLSTNGGTSWTDLFGAGRITMNNGGVAWIEGHAIHWAGSVAIDPFNPERAFVTSGNGVFSTNNLSATNSTWTFRVSGLEETVPLDIASIPNGPLFTVIGDYDGFLHTNPAQFVRTHQPAMGTSTGLAVAWQNTQILARAGNEIYRTTNQGTSWTLVNRPNTQVRGRIALSADGEVLLWNPEQSGTMHRTANAGSSWTVVTGISAETAPMSDPVNANKFYAYANNTLFMSTNKGVSFAAVSNGPGSGGARNLRLAPGREGDLWIPMGSGGLRRSTNAGTTAFTAISAVQSCAAVGFGRAAPGATYPAIYIWGRANNGPVGIYRSIDVGVSWVRINDNQNQFGGPGNGQFISGDMNVFGRVYMSTAGRGTIYGEIVSGVSSSVQSSSSLAQSSSSAPISSSVLSSSSQTPSSSSCVPIVTTPFVQVNGGTWTQSASAEVPQGGSVMFGPQPSTGGSWSWTGPAGFTASTREAGRSNLQLNHGGTYIATFTSGAGCISRQNFTLTVRESSVALLPTKSALRAGVLHLERGGELHMEVRDLRGRLLWSQRSRVEAGNHVLPDLKLMPGYGVRTIRVLLDGQNLGTYRFAEIER